MTTRNLKLFNFIFPLSGAFFFTPILIPFFFECGLSVGQTFWVESIFSVFVLIFEIPSGFISDFFGRKKTLITAFFCLVISGIIYGFAKNFGQFVIGEFFWALGTSLRSGTDSALIFETLKNHGAQKNFQKVFGHFKFLEIVAIGISAVIGGFLAKFFGFTICFFATAVAAFFATILCFFLHEFKIEKSQKIAPHEIFKISKKIFHDEKTFRYLIFFIAVATATATLAFWFEPLLFLRLKIPLQLFGILLLVSKIICASAAKSTHFFVKFFGEKKFLGANFVILISIFVAIAIFRNYFLILILFGGGAVFNFLLVFIDEKINKKFVDRNRATALSVNNFLRGFLRATLTFIVGTVFDFWNFEIAATFIAGFIAIFGGIFLIKSKYFNFY